MANFQNLYIHTVLVRPIYSGNVGQAVRATMNMGYGKLFLINPQCEVNMFARKGAAGAQKELKEHTVYNNWEEFNNAHPGSFRIGLTRRIGKNRKLFSFETGVENFFESLIDKKEKTSMFKKEFFLVFGPEDHGLATKDLDSVNISCYLPLYGDFKSLNLSQATLLSQYIAHSVYFNKFSKKFKMTFKNKEKEDFFKNAVSEEFFPDEVLFLWLKSIGFKIDFKKMNAFKTIKRMILRGFPSQKELTTFEKALRQAIKLIKK